MRDDSDEKPCISFLAREVQPTAKSAKARVQEKGGRPFAPVLTAATEGWRIRPWPFTPRAKSHPATKPTKARVEEEKGARPFGPVSTAATEGWRTRPWPFTPRAEAQPATKPAKVRVEEEKGVRLFGPVSTAATEGWRTRPSPFTLRAESTISFRGPVAEEKLNLYYTFGMVNDEKPVEKVPVALSSVAVTSEDSVNSNLATFMAPAEALPGEVKEPLSGGPSTPSGGRASPEIARPSPAPVPATARRRAAMRNNKIRRPNVVTRRAAVEPTGAVTRYRKVRPNNNNNDDNSINNNNHATLAELFQPSTLHKLR